jgi:hypothetical protein
MNLIIKYYLEELHSPKKKVHNKADIESFLFSDLGANPPAYIY